MIRRTGRVVTLPHVTPRIWLKSDLANTLELIAHADSSGRTLDYLERNRIFELRAKLEELISGGAVIHMDMRLALNR